MQPARRTLIWPWVLLVLLIIGVYLVGLDGAFAPTNGDEMVYIHIARMTAESGHWLPLQSEILDTRNTKPPLLFWQAIVAGGWGQHWSLWALRLPSILYTLATTGLIAFFTFRMDGRARTACLAAALYLLFFSTFRYGRVYLTSAPETFWLTLPLWWVLWLRVREPDSDVPGAGTYTLFGLAFGLGAAYKSFALVAPAAAALWCAMLLGTPRLRWSNVWRVSAGVTWSALIGIGIFALWFAIDPDPAAVWQEFVLAENAGKMSNAQGYWHAALFGAYPMWLQLLAYPENAGLLFFLVLGWAWSLAPAAFKRQSYFRLTPQHAVLLAWLVVWLVVFTLPSQRSARYVIPAMPALAIAMALAWERIGKAWFGVTLLIAAPILILLARISWVMGGLQIAEPLQVAITLIAACACLAGAALVFYRASWCRPAALVAVLGVYATFNLMVEPLGGPANNYSNALQQQMKAKTVAVPNGFTGQYERFHFVLPGAVFTPYDAEGRNTGALHPELTADDRLNYLLGRFDAVVWLQDDPRQDQPSCSPQCRVLGTRWHVKSRHKSGEITLANLWQPGEWLFRKEWLIAPTAP